MIVIIDRDEQKMFHHIFPKRRNSFSSLHSDSIFIIKLPVVDYVDSVSSFPFCPHTPNLAAPVFVKFSLLDVAPWVRVG